MDWGVAAQWVATFLVAGGLVFNISRNGKKEVKKDTELKTELTNKVGTINSQLADPENGLGAIKKAVDEQKVHCAKVSTSLTEQVKANRRDINNVQKKRRS